MCSPDAVDIGFRKREEATCPGIMNVLQKDVYTNEVVTSIFNLTTSAIE